MRSNVLWRNIEDVPEETGNCGRRKRIFTSAESMSLGLSRLMIEHARPHFHKDSSEIYYVLGGQGLLWVDRKPYPLSPGVSVLIPPGSKHMAESHSNLEVLVIMSPSLAEDGDMHLAETSDVKME